MGPLVLFKYISLACIASVSTQVIARRFGARAKKMEVEEGGGKRKETFLLAPPPSFMFLFSFQLLFQWKKHFHLTAAFLEPLK